MVDPLETLKELGDAPARPLPAGEVRRRGDRRRRRRTALQALGAAAGITALVSAGLALAARPGTAPPAPITATPSPAPHARVLGPDGYRALRLGMDAAQVRATGDAEVARAPASGCAGVWLTDHPRRPRRVDGYLSARRGLVAVYARADMSTPEGIHPGSTFAQVKEAYPRGKFSADGYWIVPLGHGVAYEFGIERHHRVGEMALMLQRQDCFN